MNDVVSNPSANDDFFCNDPVARPLEFNGKTKTYFFKRINGEQRIKINRGQKVTLNSSDKDPNSGKHTMDVDMSDFELKRQMLVHFSCCTEEGRPYYRRLEDVQKLPETAIAMLGREAEEVNKDLEDPKKS